MPPHLRHQLAARRTACSGTCALPAPGSGARPRRRPARTGSAPAWACAAAPASPPAPRTPTAPASSGPGSPGAGCRRSIASRAWRPSCATTVRNPSVRRVSRTSSAVSRSSSTTSTVGSASGWPASTRRTLAASAVRSTGFTRCSAAPSVSALTASLQHRYHHHRDVPRGRLPLERGQQVQAAAVGQHDVQQDHVRMARGRQRRSLLGAGRGEHGQPFLLRSALTRRVSSASSSTTSTSPSSVRSRPGGGGAWSSGRSSSGQAEAEDGAPALLAVHVDGGAVRVQDALDDGQPQPDAAEPARGGAVHLVEAVEDLADLVARDADAGVADADLRGRPLGARHAAGRDRDATRPPG